MTKRVKKPKPPASFTPHDAIVLAVDTAENSGWALYVRGELKAFGEVDMLNEEQIACDIAINDYVGDTGLPAVLVYERPFRGTTQGQWIGAWKRQWVESGGVKSRMVGVYPSTWRARVLGSGRLGRDDARKAEQRRAQAVAMASGHITTGMELGDDCAAAIAIGQWAIKAGEVLAKLPVAKKRKAGV